MATMKAKANNRKIGFLEATAIGIGGMVGGGIFAVLGLAVELTHGGAPVAFAISGIVALVTTYSYVRLSITYPSQGGTVTFLDRAFGPGLLSGTLNLLLWINYIVMLSLYSYAFGSYGAELIGGETTLWRHLLITGSVLIIAGLNLLSARLIGEAEDWIVGIKLVILLLFVMVGMRGIDTSRLVPSSWASPLDLLAGGMIIFLAFEGFELIANAARDVHEPSKTLPKAFFTAVGLVIVLYVLIAVVAVGNLSTEKIMAAKDYALAAAAMPFLGKTGYLLISVAALLSTASAINSTIYGAARLSYIIAKDGELPEFLEKKLWNRPVEGLVITAGATVLLANFADLSSLSVMGSAGFLLIFAMVNAANAKLSMQTGSRRWLSVAGIALCLGALCCLVWQTAIKAANHLWILVGMICLAFLIEGGFRLLTDRELRRSAQRG